MKKNTYKKIPTKKTKEFLIIYETVKKHQERIKNISNKKYGYAVDKINRICKQLDRLAKQKILTHSEEIKENICTDFFQSISHWHIRKDFGSEDVSMNEDKKLKVKGKRGRPKEDYALDFLIYLLASECENDFELIADFLAVNEIVGIDKSHSSDGVKKRFERIREDTINKWYRNFVNASVKAVVTQQGGPDTTANIVVYWELPLEAFPLK